MKATEKSFVCSIVAAQWPRILTSMIATQILVIVMALQQRYNCKAVAVERFSSKA